jgi:hypothetical protein
LTALAQQTILVIMVWKPLAIAFCVLGLICIVLAFASCAYSWESPPTIAEPNSNPDTYHAPWTAFYRFGYGMTAGIIALCFAFYFAQKTGPK